MKKPLAYDNHDGNQLLYSQFLQTSLLYKKLNLILERFLGYLSKVMVVPSNLDKKLYIDQNFRYKDKIIVIPSGIDFSSINKINKNKFLLRSRLGINLSKKVLIFGGNRDYQPNKEAVLWINEELAPILENNFNEIMIIITGSGDIPPNIHPIIKFTGYIQDYFEHIIASDIGIVPYHMNTGISTKTIDYLASGLPTIITPEVASLFPQLIDGENIIIARDRQEFINKIIYVLNHSEEGAKIGARGKEVIEKYYDMEVVGRAWRELFKSCLRDNLQIRV
jgi:glycosyltransferase involved in cell wall biosynthesis